jgi:DNA-directed RNA polymerase specialized sigma24 family protein
MDELDAVDDRLRKLVELRFFAGLSLNDIADLTGRSERSLHRDWARARAFLHARLAEV